MRPKEAQSYSPGQSALMQQHASALQAAPPGQRQQMMGQMAQSAPGDVNRLNQNYFTQTAYPFAPTSYTGAGIEAGAAPIGLTYLGSRVPGLRRILSPTGAKLSLGQAAKTVPKFFFSPSGVGYGAAFEAGIPLLSEGIGRMMGGGTPGMSFGQAMAGRYGGAGRAFGQRQKDIYDKYGVLGAPLSALSGILSPVANITNLGQSLMGKTSSAEGPLTQAIRNALQSQVDGDVKPTLGNMAKVAAAAQQPVPSSPGFIHRMAGRFTGLDPKVLAAVTKDLPTYMRLRKHLKGIGSVLGTMPQIGAP